MQVHAFMLMVCTLEFISVAMQLSHRSAFSADGVGLPGTQSFVAFINIFPDALLTALMVFISKGWQIGSRSIEVGAVRSVSEVVLLYIAVAIALFLWSFKTIDPATVPSMYQTPPGVILCVMRVLLLLWFSTNLWVTFNKERATAKKNFYFGFFLFGSFHFLTLPCVVLASSLAQTWQRKKAVAIVDLLLVVITYLVMWVLFGVLGRRYLRKGGEDTRGLGASDDIEMEGVDERVVGGPLGQGDIEFVVGGDDGGRYGKVGIGGYDDDMTAKVHVASDDDDDDDDDDNNSPPKFKNSNHDSDDDDDDDDYDDDDEDDSDSA